MELLNGFSKKRESKNITKKIKSQRITFNLKN